MSTLRKNINHLVLNHSGWSGVEDVDKLTDEIMKLLKQQMLDLIEKAKPGKHKDYEAQLRKEVEKL